MSASFKTAENAVRFLKGGRAITTFKSAKTGKHFTFLVATPKDAESPFFVKLLTGPDNTSNYTYMGVMDPQTLQVRLTKRSAVTCDAPSVAAFNWVGKHLAAGELSTSVEVFHEGRCGRCNRLLTHPESIERGIGPECWGKMGL